MKRKKANFFHLKMKFFSKLTCPGHLIGSASNTRPCLTTLPNIEKRFESTARSSVLNEFELPGVWKCSKILF